MTITLTREEAQQVLDALQCATPPTFSTKIVEDWQNAVEFLRARLAQPEPEPLAWDEVFDAAAAAYCRSEASRKALQLCFQTRQQTTQVSIGWTANELMAFAKTLAYVCATPPQREWQGLTDEERYLNEPRSAEEIEYAKAIEAKLKEKNNG